MSDGDDLLASILADPDDDTPRLVYADWLDENGQPERAEFIRVQVELARQSGNGHRVNTGDRPDTSRRHRGLSRLDFFLGSPAEGPETLKLLAAEKTLLAKYGSRWLEPLRGKGGPLEADDAHAQFHRGFVAVVWMTARGFLARGEQLVRLSPVRELRVTYVPPEGLRDLVTSVAVQKLNTLDISDARLGRAIPEAVAASPVLSVLKTLRLRGCGLNDEDALKLSALPFDWPLAELDVSFNPIGPLGLAALQKRYGDALRTNATD